VWNQPIGSLNLNLGWKLDNGLRITLDGRNLLAEEQVQTTDVSYQVWRITERDRTVAATVQAKW
jgi:outer membrane receptor protein involved in Fe transport